MERLRVKLANEGETLRQMISVAIKERNGMFDDVRAREERYDSTLRAQVLCCCLSIPSTHSIHPS